MTMTRRWLLRNAGRLAALGTAGRLGPFLGAGSPQQPTADSNPLIVRSSRPQDFETPVDRLTSFITSNDLFFVRSHIHTPQVQPENWTLTVDGLVDRPLVLRLAELEALPQVTAVITLECAGNGRAFFDPPVAGVQWRKGAVGTARWTGVRLADVLARAGVKTAAQFVLLDGADRSIGNVPDFVRTVPLAKARHPDTLLVHAMNGVPLPQAHGFPLRALVPGWEGAYSVKWLTTIRVLDHQHDGFFVQTGYRYPIRPVTPGATVDPQEMEPLTGLTVKSLIVAPAEGSRVPLGRVRIAGFAWAGEADVSRVDVSVDAGRTWQSARLGAERARCAWRSFEYQWQVKEPGSHEVLARATDDRGRVQPPVSPWNPSGYLWNAIDRIKVTAVSGQSSSPASIPPADGPLPATSETALIRAKCVVCHEADLITQQRLNEAGWSRELDKMIRWGATVSTEERDPMLKLLARLFPPR